ncbi:MAG TPA: hypothetical protein VK211_26685 [Kamptonema sp.]|nr:hypothetical protein [Kamptonema sp.]
MEMFKLRSRAGADGILHLQVPVGVRDNDFEVIVVVQSVGSATDDKTREDLSWGPSFFERTFECFQNEP